MENNTLGAFTIPNPPPRPVTLPPPASFTVPPTISTSLPTAVQPLPAAAAGIVLENASSPRQKYSERRGAKLIFHPGRPSKQDDQADSLLCRWTGCGLVFENAEQAREHESAHAAPENNVESSEYICEILKCGRAFLDLKQLRKHLSLHRPKDFVCDTCGKKFHESTKLRRHEQVHSGAKPFTCEHCGKEFGFKANLKTHMRVHTGERPFSCTVDGCTRRFAQASNRNAHVLTHFKNGVLLPLPPPTPSPSSEMLGSGTEQGIDQSDQSKAAFKRRSSSSLSTVSGNGIPLPPLSGRISVEPKMQAPSLLFSSPIPMARSPENFLFVGSPRPGSEHHLGDGGDTAQSDLKRFKSAMASLNTLRVPSFDTSSSFTNAIGLSDPLPSTFRFGGQSGVAPTGLSVNANPRAAPGLNAFRCTSPFMMSPPPGSLSDFAQQQHQKSFQHQQQHQLPQSSPASLPSLPPTPIAVSSSLGNVSTNSAQSTPSIQMASMQSTPTITIRSGISSDAGQGNISNLSSVAPLTGGSQQSANDPSALLRLAQMSTDVLDRQGPKVSLTFTPPPFPTIPTLGGPQTCSGPPGSTNSSSSSDKSLLFSSSFNSLASGSSNSTAWMQTEDIRLLTPQIGLRFSPDAFKNQS